MMAVACVDTVVDCPGFRLFRTLRHWNCTLDILRLPCKIVLCTQHFGKEIIAKELRVEEDHPDVHRLYLAVYKSFMEVVYICWFSIIFSILCFSL